MSPVLLIVLAALWAAVLIPATRGGRTAAHDDRTMTGFSTAMRTLSRRPLSTSDQRRILVPTASVTDAKRRATVTGRRRRRVLFVRLLWLAGVTLVAAVALRGPWLYAHLLVDAGVVAAVVWLRRCAIREAAAARAERLERLAARDEAEREAYLRSRARQRSLVAARAEPVPMRRAVGD